MTNTTKPGSDHTADTSAPLVPLPPTAARATTLAGAALALVGTFLPWTWSQEFPGNLTVTGYPGGLQTLTLATALLTLLFTLSGYGVKGLRWLTPGGTNSPVRLLALAALGTTGFTMGAISVVLGGLINLDPGAWISGVGALIATLGAFALPNDPYTEEAATTFWARFRRSLKAPAPSAAKKLSGWAEILLISVVFALGLFVFAYGIDIEYPELFIGFLITVGFGFAGINKAGLPRRIGQLTGRHRKVAMIAALVAAACFPFTQTNDQYALIGAQVLIFATVALGLNVVVGLAGLLDLGYVAFLGVGAYTAALVSGTASSAFDVKFPFWAAALAGAAASLIFGVIIGAPTLRLRGDYLAIVTLGFGEIFRITVLNLNGTTGPDVTNGSNGITNVPDLSIFGFDLGTQHEILGFSLTRSSNYFLLMMLFTIITVLVFHRSAQSRIGRAWVAIREDETAATAMGINGFRLKLLAFALGASLAGFAGSVQAHLGYSVTPEQYQFAGSVAPNSAFLLAAVILGGMGTIAGPLIGAALLYLIPAKLAFMQDYQLVLFGLALILLMRFRPEGLIADRRKKLEFHENDQLAVPDEKLPGPTTDVAKAGA
ncbi:branched-chain amino acid ABC transporter permease [Streptomyces sp. NPDC004111]|uniref:branched-chain amino acid ABC transporter permease n=1 Tax=Streptomyces sp. NPDC004111 TaxID=3364690 RepID=UPI003691F9C9